MPLVSLNLRVADPDRGLIDYGIEITPTGKPDRLKVWEGDFGIHGPQTTKSLHEVAIPKSLTLRPKACIKDLLRPRWRAQKGASAPQLDKPLYLVSGIDDNGECRAAEYYTGSEPAELCEHLAAQLQAIAHLNGR